MSILARFAPYEGNWIGKNILQDPHTNGPDESPATAMIKTIQNGQFVRLDYTWAYQGKPQEGSFLIGFDSDADEISVHWIDTWHMSNKVMVFTGRTSKDALMNVRGSYPAPPGPDWGWRIEIIPDTEKKLRMIMHNIWPEGREDLAMETSFTKRK